MKALAYVAAFIIVCLLSYGGWVLAKEWNYYFSYESMVKETVCEMVKPEHLKEKCN